MNWLIFALILAAGLAVGSFISCLIWRLRVGRSIWERHSVCPRCLHPLGFKDLWPILSYALQKGRCRYCQEFISWQYPVVEGATAILFWLAYWRFGLSWQLAANCLFLVILLIIFIYDLKYYQILDKVVLPAIALALVINFWLGADIWRLLLGGLVGGAWFLWQWLVSRGRWVGDGDIRLGLLLGVMLGWPQVILALFLAYISGAAVSLALLAAGKKKLKSPMPLGVFLAAGGAVGLFFGEEIISWYLKLSGF
ncbi:MAG: prepilin peptidase [Patescibacteria group bacterium]|jgi:prepilin signal peptidase PulO-like enzyme (type II secretory pathway)